MFKKSLVFSLVSLMACAFVSCDDDDEQTPTKESCLKLSMDFDSVKKECVPKSGKAACTSASTADCSDACDATGNFPNRKWYWDKTNNKVKDGTCINCKAKADGSGLLCDEKKDCTKDSTIECYAVCDPSDPNKKLRWNGTAVISETCKECNKGTDNKITCTYDPCVAGGTEYCLKNCKADKSEGYYYAGGAVVTKSCPNNDCKVENDNVFCESTDRCDASYVSSCATDGKSGSYCDTANGIIKTTICNDDQVCERSDTGFIACKPPCTANSGSDTCSPACNAARTEGYYSSFNETTQTREIKTKKCSTSQKCQIAGTSVSCVATDLVDQECTGTKCSTVDGNPYFCDKKTKSYYYDGSSVCGTNTCGVCTDGFGGCGYGDGGKLKCETDGHDVACTGTVLTTGGEVGDCCDPDTYTHTCKDKNTLIRCRSWGKVETMTCKGDCKVDDKNKYTCTK